MECSFCKALCAKAAMRIMDRIERETGHAMNPCDPAQARAFREKAHAELDRLAERVLRILDDSSSKKTPRDPAGPSQQRTRHGS